ncbi:MAG TPA: UDP-N-acetylmuramate dehydrogenase [Chitinophagaceae bacterium]|nr:UDP-N-acetylmuramate dehydrogenase [Chitinophagaceae bacterium]
MKVQENISLRHYNTFGIDAKARYFATFSNSDELEELLTPDSRLPTLTLGGGSNILFTKDFDGLVLRNEIKGINELHEDAEYIYVKAGAGENWHQFVLHCIKRNWAGVENLSLIPGNVGASPLQNIGAYGVELEDVFYSLEAFHLREKRIFTFSRSDCEFGYRNSVFKGRYKDQFAITSVTFRLRKVPIFHTSYGAINEELEKMGVKELSIHAISQAVINIRSAKLPDPKEIGNAGSFYKNPAVSKKQFEMMKEQFPGIIGYEMIDGTIKLAAGWMIEQCGWKGFRKGDAGCHAKQALVLLNYGKANGKEIYDLSEEILLSVDKKFGVKLEKEVNII